MIPIRMGARRIARKGMGGRGNGGKGRGPRGKGAKGKGAEGHGAQGHGSQGGGGQGRGASRKPSDPLAELARLIGQTDPYTENAPRRGDQVRSEPEPLNWR